MLVIDNLLSQGIKKLHKILLNIFLDVSVFPKYKVNDVMQHFLQAIMKLRNKGVVVMKMSDLLKYTQDLKIEELVDVVHRLQNLVRIGTTI